MKTTTTLIAVLCGCLCLSFDSNAQVYSINIQNAYAQTAQAAPGDTIHIWAQEWGAARSFGYWSGDTSYLERPLEWHTRLIMPAHDVSLTAVTPVLPTGSNDPLTMVNIMGRDTLKRVFFYFPPNQDPPGVCWLWHGTNGSADSWAGTEYEQNQFVKYLVSKGWGVIITESEESTKGKDLSGDGNIRYDYTPDTLNNVDLQNVRAIRDTFINRGKMSWSTPQASVGFSAGGAFSTLLASVLDWQAAVTHCSAGISTLIPFSHTPILFSMNARDNHPDVGTEGLLKAIANYHLQDSLGICTGFYLLEPSPTYPQRFKRLPGITTSMSAAINNELLGNDCFGNGGYLTKTPSEIENAVIADPASWPVALSLSGPQRQFVLDQLEVLWTSHHFHSDYMAADFAFISDPCKVSVGTHTAETPALLFLYPNPAGDQLTASGVSGLIRIIDVNGKIQLQSILEAGVALDISSLPAGFYFLQSEMGWGKFIKQ